jgi:hypothetical protein
MPVRPEAIIVHEKVQASYDTWERLAPRGQQPSQAVWKSLQVCLSRLRQAAQWGEVVRQSFIPRNF